MARAKKSSAEKVAPKLADERERITARRVNRMVAEAKAARTLPKLTLLEPHHASALPKEGGSWGSAALIGGEELWLEKLNEDGSISFAPAGLSRFKELRFDGNKALELVSGLKEFLQPLTKKAEAEADEALREQSEAELAERIRAAKQLNEAYGTW